LNPKQLNFIYITNFYVLSTYPYIYGMGIESRWEQDFPHLSRPALWPTQPPIQRVVGLFPEGKWPGRGTDHPSPSSAKVK